MSKHLRCYIATSLSRIADHNALRDRLRVEFGVELTYDWTTHGSMQAQPDRWSEVALAELNGVVLADFVVVLLPGGRGTHVELGAALASGTPVILQASGSEVLAAGGYNCIFYSHPGVEVVLGSMEDLIGRLPGFLRRIK